MKVTEILANAEPHHLPKARNLETIWWWSGYLMVRFKGRRTLYVHGPDIEEAKRDMLVKNHFPDHLFNGWKKKYAWQVMKVEA